MIKTWMLSHTFCLHKCCFISLFCVIFFLLVFLPFVSRLWWRVLILVYIVALFLFCFLTSILFSIWSFQLLHFNGLTYNMIEIVPVLTLILLPASTNEGLYFLTFGCIYVFLFSVSYFHFLRKGIQWIKIIDSIVVEINRDKLSE